LATLQEVDQAHWRRHNSIDHITYLTCMSDNVQ